MKITKEDILKIEHDLFYEFGIWENIDDKEYLERIPVYMSGAQDMANAIIAKLEEKKG